MKNIFFPVNLINKQVYNTPAENISHLKDRIFISIFQQVNIFIHWLHL